MKKEKQPSPSREEQSGYWKRGKKLGWADSQLPHRKIASLETYS